MIMQRMKYLISIIKKIFKKVSIENVRKIYEIIFTNIFQNTLKTNLWKTTIQRKVTYIKIFR